MSGSPMRKPIVVTHEHGRRFGAQVRQHRVITDQSERAGGADGAPSPTELLSAALGSCIALYVYQFCTSRGLSHDGLRIEVLPFNAPNPNRIAELQVTVRLSQELSPHVREMLERVVRSCPVHNTLAHEAAVSVAIEDGARVHATSHR
jgi:putative redox protein